MAEAEDLKSSQCGFDPHSGHWFVCNLFNFLFSIEFFRLGYNRPPVVGFEREGG